MAKKASPSKKSTAQQPTDTRAQRRKNDRALFGAVIAVLIFGGGGLIYVIYGWQALITGIACLSVGAAVLFLLWAILGVIERWVED